MKNSQILKPIVINSLTMTKETDTTFEPTLKL